MTIYGADPINCEGVSGDRYFIHYNKLIGSILDIYSIHFYKKIVINTYSNLLQHNFIKIIFLQLGGNCTITAVKVGHGCYPNVKVAKSMN